MKYTLSVFETYLTWSLQWGGLINEVMKLPNSFTVPVYMIDVTHFCYMYRYQFVVLPDNWAIHVPHVEIKYFKQFLIVSKNLCNDINGTCI